MESLFKAMEEDPTPQDKKRKGMNGAGQAAADGSQKVLTQELYELLIDNAKLGTHLASRSRMHDADTLFTAIMDPTLSFLPALDGCGKKWHKMKAAGTQPCSSPHLLAWVTAILQITGHTKVIEDAKKDPTIQQALTILVDHKDKTVNLDALEGEVIWCIYGTTHDRKAKLMVSTSTESRPLRIALMYILAKVFDSEIKKGPPPRSKHERKVIAGLVKIGEFKKLDGTDGD